MDLPKLFYDKYLTTIGTYVPKPTNHVNTSATIFDYTAKYVSPSVKKKK